MALIEMKEGSKEFKVYKHQNGLLKNLKSLVFRNYEIKNAVEDISFSIESGELVGYIGPNGAGKSTTIKMLSGILLPSHGEILVDGNVPYLNRKKNAMKIGVVFGQRSQLNWDLPMEDTFELYKRMYKVPDKQYRKSLDMFVELMQMQDFLRKPVRNLSLGQKMRAEISIALLHDPQVLYLDEPTIGLDVLVKDRIRTFIRELNREKHTTVILTTHDMTDIDQICNRIIMIDKGRIIEDISLSSFKKAHTDHYNILVEFRGSVQNLNDPRVQFVRKVNENSILFSIPEDDISVNEILQYFSNNFDITDISIKKQEIDEIVRNIYMRN